MDGTTYAVLRVDGDGKSYFEDDAVDWHPTVYVPETSAVAEPVPVSALTLTHCGSNYVSEWHPAPCRQFMFVLRGGLEVTSGRHETRRFAPGAWFLVEDTTGGGHLTRTVGADRCVFVTVACAQQD